MKKSKILFISAIVLTLVTVGLLFYKNSCEQKLLEYRKELIAVDYNIREFGYTSSKGQENGELANKIDKCNTGITIFYIVLGITIVVWIGGIVLVVIEKKKS